MSHIDGSGRQLLEDNNSFFNISTIHIQFLISLPSIQAYRNNVLHLMPFRKN